MKKSIVFCFCIFFSILTFSQENCNNGIDDDGDGKIDLNDSDCLCSGATTTSLVNNHNFEQMNFCPNDFAQFNAVTSWFQPNSATSDYLNSCGFVPASAIGAGIYPLPASHGNGVGGILISQDYREFIAICTNTTLLAGTKYQINFDIAASTSGRVIGSNFGQVCNDGVLNAGRIDISVYGKRNCDTSIPPNTNGYAPGFVEVGRATYLPSQNWNQLSIEFTPNFDINSIALGATPYSLPTYIQELDYQSCFPYFYFDNVILNNASSLGIKINAMGIFCENTLTLSAGLDLSLSSGYSFQWYKDGIAISGATNSTLNVSYSTSNTGNYQVKIFNANSCRISPFYNVNTVIDVPEFTFVQSPCFPGNTTVTITTPADQYSFDNGVTWSANPSKDNLTALYNPILVLIRKNGCTSNTRYVVLTFPPLSTINVPPQVTVVQPGCQTNGSITVTTPAMEYSFDNGVTWTTNPTLSNLPPNAYHDYKVKIRTLSGCVTVANYVVMMPFRLPEPTATYTNSGCGMGGTITITTPAHEYSVNGGVSWSMNPYFTNLSANSYNVMVKNEFNCISEIKVVFIGVDHLQEPQATFTQPDCGTLGSITVTTVAAQYSFDDGLTWTTNNIATNLTPGFYHIKVKDSQNCVSIAKLVNLQPYVWNVAINLTVINSSCTNNGSINISTVAQEYSIDNGINWSLSPSFTNLAPGYYYIKIRNRINCESDMVIGEIQDFTTMTPNYQITNAGCNTYGSITITTIADFYSFDNGNTWSSSNSITNLTGNLNFSILVKTNSCSSQSINANFNSNYSPNPTVTNYHAYICDAGNDGTENINLNDYNAFFVNNPTNYNFHYFASHTDAQNLNLSNQIQNLNSYGIINNTMPIYAAIVSAENCYSVAEVTFTFLQSPIIPLIPDNAIVCENRSISISAGNGFDSYLWSNGQTTSSIVITQPGNNSVTVGHDYGNQICYTTKNFSISLSGPATITSIATHDFTDNDNTIEVNATGSGVYEYSLDGIIYQDSNLFTDLNSGIYTVYIRDKNNCGITTEDVFLLMYPKFFTPNNDGYNDTWKIMFSQLEPGIKISIFDRYGKLLKVLNQSSAWDGKYNENNLPADDYWFLVTRKNGKEFRNHFALIR